MKNREFHVRLRNRGESLKGLARKLGLGSHTGLSQMVTRAAERAGDVAGVGAVVDGGGVGGVGRRADGTLFDVEQNFSETNHKPS